MARVSHERSECFDIGILFQFTGILTNLVDDKETQLMKMKKWWSRGNGKDITQLTQNQAIDHVSNRRSSVHTDTSCSIFNDGKFCYNIINSFNLRARYYSTIIQLSIHTNIFRSLLMLSLSDHELPMFLRTMEDGAGNYYVSLATLHIPSLGASGSVHVVRAQKKWWYRVITKKSLPLLES